MKRLVQQTLSTVNGGFSVQQTLSTSNSFKIQKTKFSKNLCSLKESDTYKQKCSPTPGSQYASSTIYGWLADCMLDLFLKKKGAQKISRECLLHQAFHMKFRFTK